MQTPIVLNTIDIFAKTRRKPFLVYFVILGAVLQDLTFHIYIFWHQNIILRVQYRNTSPHSGVVCFNSVFSCSISIRERNLGLSPHIADQFQITQRGISGRTGSAMCSLERRETKTPGSTRPPLQQMATIDLGSLNLETEVSFILYLFSVCKSLYCFPPSHY